MNKRIYDIIIKPNMVITAYDRNYGFYGVTFIKCDDVIAAVQSKLGKLDIYVLSENETIGGLFDKNHWKIDEILDIKDFNLSEGSRIIYKQV